MQQEASRAAPMSYGGDFGRLRLNQRMWSALYRVMQMQLKTMWDYHHTLVNPSSESIENLHRIREIQKIMRNLETLGIEKGWSLNA